MTPAAAPRPSSTARRVLPVAVTVLTWGAALLYPPVLFLTAEELQFGFEAVEVAPAVLLTLLVLSLVRRGPLPALALLGVAWAGAVSQMPELEVALLAVACTDGPLGYIAMERPRRTSLTALAMVFFSQMCYAAFVINPPAMPSALGLLGMAAMVAWLVGDSIRQRRLHAVQLAEQAAARAITAERLRIARELHDMVAHSIGIIAIQAGVGGRVIDTQPDEARNALRTIETTSRETLAGLRRMLTALRRVDPDDPSAPRAPAPGLADLDHLARTTGEAGVRVEVRRRGERRPLPAEVDLAAFRIIQEAVTNVVRHAGTDHCLVSVAHLDGELLIEVVDEGRGSSSTPAGYGLTGMRERAELLKGSLTAGPRFEGGFRVEARLPLPEAVR